MKDSLAKFVRDRAQRCCEYCQMPQIYDELPFDNHHKGPNLAGIDPKTRKRSWLFNPRRPKWNRHFRWDGPTLIGRTAVGRATIAVLAINLPHRVRHCAQLIAEGVFPPNESAGSA